ncbi:MAG: AraC family transcriptional regulator [Flavobacteriales bacterium]|nr:AraC family transcriptional regulator [Flavobacteriales bacterium]
MLFYMLLIDSILFDFNEKSAVLVLFGVQCLLFAVLFWHIGITENKRHPKWLAAFMLLGALYLGPFLFGYAGWYSRAPYRHIMFFVPFKQLFLIGPVYYFFVKSLLTPKVSLNKKDLLHFIPALAYFVYSFIIFIVDKLILDEFYFYADGKDKDLSNWYQIAGFISMVYYLVLSLRYYTRYRKRSLEEVSFADEIAFKWVKHFALAFGVIVFLRVLFFILNPEWWNFGNKFWYYLCFSISLHYISIVGYTYMKRSYIQPVIDVPLDRSLEGSSEQEMTSSECQLQEQESDLSSWKERILDLFKTDQLHTNPSLTLTELAHELNTNRSVVSKVINQEFEMNFNDFINKQRVFAVIDKFQNGEHKESTLLGLAYECGFNSKTTFNRAFKKHLGMTPQQYIYKNQL